MCIVGLYNFSQYYIFRTRIISLHNFTKNQYNTQDKRFIKITIIIKNNNNNDKNID